MSFIIHSPHSCIFSFNKSLVDYHIMPGPVQWWGNWPGSHGFLHLGTGGNYSAEGQAKCYKNVEPGWERISNTKQIKTDDVFKKWKKKIVLWPNLCWIPPGTHFQHKFQVMTQCYTKVYGLLAASKNRSDLQASSPIFSQSRHMLQEIGNASFL